MAMVATERTPAAVTTAHTNRRAIFDMGNQNSASRNAGPGQLSILANSRQACKYTRAAMGLSWKQSSQSSNSRRSDALQSLVFRHPSRLVIPTPFTTSHSETFNPCRSDAERGGGIWNTNFG